MRIIQLPKSLKPDHGDLFRIGTKYFRAIFRFKSYCLANPYYPNRI